MARPSPGSYRLTRPLAAAHSAGVVCLADAAYGKTYKLHASRPTYSRARDFTPRADYYGLADAKQDEGLVVPDAPGISRVTISGPLETRAGYHGDCGGWSDGYDAFAERMIEALGEGDVLLVFEEAPGGAVMGIVECAALILAAKAQYGRRITAVCSSGMVASAAYWLACALTDKGSLYITAGSMAGSIGARSAHVSEAGALSQAGLEWTDFAYPAGKVALSPARALSDTGKARGQRDVMDAFNAFQSAVTQARPWLTRKAIIALDADMRTGAAAVAAGLCDAVATIEDVEAWALSRANGENMDPEKDEPAAEDMPPAEPGDDNAKACAECSEEMPEGAKFCAQCGTAASAAEPDEEEAPPSSKPAPAPPGATAATMLGLRPGASDLAIRTALAPVLAEQTYMRKALGASSFGEARGKMRALSEDAKQGVKAAQDLKKQRAANDKRERIDLLVSLAKANLPGFPRGDLLIDEVNDAGAIVGMRAAGIYATTPLADLRGFVKGKLANASEAPERSPFAPSEDRAAPNRKASDESAALAARNGIAPEAMAAADSYIDNALGARQ